MELFKILVEHRHDVAFSFLIIYSFSQIESKIIVTHLFNHIHTVNLVGDKLI